MRQSRLNETLKENEWKGMLCADLDMKSVADCGFGWADELIQKKRHCTNIVLQLTAARTQNTIF
jgi:hypothetical protein